MPYDTNQLPPWLQQQQNPTAWGGVNNMVRALFANGFRNRGRPGTPMGTQQGGAPSGPAQPQFTPPASGPFAPPPGGSPMGGGTLPITNPSPGTPGVPAMPPTPAPGPSTLPGGMSVGDVFNMVLKPKQGGSFTDMYPGVFGSGGVPSGGSGPPNMSNMISGLFGGGGPGNFNFGGSGGGLGGGPTNGGGGFA